MRPVPNKELCRASQQFLSINYVSSNPRPYSGIEVRHVIQRRIFRDSEYPEVKVRDSQGTGKKGKMSEKGRRNESKKDATKSTIVNADKSLYTRDLVYKYPGFICINPFH